MRACIKSILAMLMMFAATHAFAFKADGYSTGMTLQQFEQAVRANGLAVIGGEDKVNYDITEPGTLHLRGNVAFCKGALFFYTRPVAFDSDYAPLLATLLKKYGQPSSVQSKQSEFGSEHHFIYTVVMKWQHGVDTIELDLTPQVLNSKGGYVVSRSASLSYISKSSCSR